MNDINLLFFELIRVSLGNQERLSRVPTAKEWERIYRMAVKQSLLGICFAGVQRLGANADDGFSAIGMPEMLYLTWMGMAAKIQQRNEVVNRQCVELQERLAVDGMQSCVLKGQGVATLYGDHLRSLRQSGDIDVWVLPNEGETENEHIARVVKYAKEFNPQSHFSGKHIDLYVFDDTEVELHVTPAKMNCPWHNKLLQKWFLEAKGSMVQNNQGFTTPSVEFNVVHLLLHCYDHLLFEGVGLRQVMDYYWTLSDSLLKGKNLNKTIDTLESLGLIGFASAMMWVLGHVFAMEREYMICEPNEKEGRFLLNEIMTGGNFGKYGKASVMEGHGKGKVAFAIASIKHKMRFLSHYPSEVLWAPYQMLVYYLETIIKKNK